MSIRCGKCKGRHETVDEVRSCHQSGQGQLPGVADYAEERSTIRFLEGDRRDRPDGDWQQHFRNLADQLPKGALVPNSPSQTWRARYAVEIEGTLKFYQVDKPTEGKWSGYTFIKVQASDETWPVKALKERVKVLDAIMEDPQEAMLRYGREIGQCAHCGRTLTNEESREFGIGPICRGKMGW